MTALFLIMAIGAAACGSGGEVRSGRSDKTTQNRVGTMNEQQAIQRAEEIIRQATDGMVPKPTLKKVGPGPVGPCLADDDAAASGRRQVGLMYQLTDVPGNGAKRLLRHVRDAWVEQGYTFTSPDADWSVPFPKFFMRTPTDDFWMNGLIGPTNKETGEGIAAISVTSPCFAGSAGTPSEADPAAYRTSPEMSDAERRVLGHSSRIYEALGVHHQPQAGDGVSRVEDGSDVLTHHTWSTVPLSGEERKRAMRRGRDSLNGAGWDVRVLPLESDEEMIVARHPVDGSLARVVASADGSVRVAVTAVEHESARPA
ncbi:hypothetical protein [Streptomyces sp. MBT27]|uniref:hypothetical protein n=1 Tax=Streptomyces sp. MBT27 TaxID=1488356 RepID=UPI001F07F0BB|nr:hypothetical protein [Streptomyces sp. MBT27]